MNSDRRRAVAALTAAGLLWGTTVPLSKLALVWLSPGWLTFARFGLAAAILLVAARAQVRAVCSPAVLASGAIGYGGSVVVQNAGISRTSVSHAALLIGAAPVLIAIIAAVWHRTVARPVAWAGFALSLAGVGLVAGGGGGGATATGDGLVLASLLLASAFTVAQARLLSGRDPVAVTAVQFLGAAIVMLPFAMVTSGMPAAPAGPGAVLATAGLVAGGTLLPFTLFAYGQSRVSAEVAGAFVNLEPLVGAVAGVVVFANPVGPAQVTGGAAILAGIALSSLPLLARNRQRPVPRGLDVALRGLDAAPSTAPVSKAPQRPVPRCRRREWRPSSLGERAELVSPRVRQHMPADVAVRLAQHRGPRRGERCHAGNRDIPVDTVLHGLRLGHRDSPLSGSAMTVPVDPHRVLRRRPP
jgi:O-acetylserine/cysteine efflux transporter